MKKNLTLRKLLVLIAIVICNAGFLKAQVDVTATAGTLNASYTTLQLAFDAINTGTHQGDITISLTGSTAETASAVLNSGAVLPASYTSVGITATVPVTISGSIAGAVIKLNGADNVTIDGRIGGTGRNITVQNTSTATATAAVWLSSVAVGNGCSNNVIRNLELLTGIDPTTSANSTYGIIMSGTTITSVTSSNGVENDNNSFIANRIIKARYGIVTRGTAASDLNISPVVTDNIIGPSAFGTDQISKCGIFMQADQGAIVSGNTIQNVGCLITQSLAGSDRIGIAIGVEGWSATASATITSLNYTVTKNIIHDIIEEKTFSSVGILVGTTQSGGATNNLIANNFIYNIRANGTAGDQVCGIGITNGNGDQIVNNSISITGDMDPGASTASTTYGNAIRIPGANVANNANFLVQNNSIYLDASSSSTAAERYYAITLNSAAYVFGTGGLNNNNYYINAANTQLQTGGLGTNTGNSITTQFATLANWQAALTAPQDAASIQSDPGYTNTASDLHLLLGTSPNINAGATVASVTDDIDGDARPNSGAYDIGADEYQLTACVTAVGGTATGDNTYCGSGTPTIGATGYSVGTGSVYQWYSSNLLADYPNGGSAVGGQNNPTTLSTGVVSATTYYWLRVTCATNSSTDNSTMVTITVNPATLAGISGASSKCVNDPAVTLTENGGNGTSWLWSTGETTQSISVNPAFTTTYTVTVTSAGPCTASATHVLTVNPNPAGVNASSSASPVCSGVSFDLSSTVNVASPTILTEDFNSGAPAWTRVNNSTGGTPALAEWLDQPNGYIYTTTTFYSNDSTQFVLTNADPQGSGSTAHTILQSPAFSTVGYTTCDLSFYHSYRDLSATQPNDSATVEASTDGVTWTNVQMYNTTTPVLLGTFTAATVNLNAFVGFPTVYVRFRYYSTWDWWWGIDNVTVTGTPVAFTFDWSSNPSGFTSTDQNPTAVTLAVTTDYTVTVTGAGGCTTTATVTVASNDPVPSISGNPAFCTGGSTTLDAGSYTSYIWSTTETTQTISVNTAGPVSVTVTNADGCTGSASATVTENPNPVVNLGGPYEQCGGTVTLDASNYTTSFAEGMDGGTPVTLYTPAGWVQQNNSVPVGTMSWFSSDNNVFPPHSGPNYIFANYLNTTGAGDISNWLMTPTVTLRNGDVFSFWTRTVDFPAFPDRLQVRMSTNGASTNVGAGAAAVGDFTTLLLDINPGLTTGGYPNVWTQYTVTVSGLGGPTSGRLAFRYFVTNGGPFGVNSDYIGVDDVVYTSAGNSTYLWSNGDNTQTSTVSTTGIFSVTVTDPNGCSGTGSADVTIHPDPVVTLGGPYEQCEGTVTLDAGTFGGGVLLNEGMDGGTTGVTYTPAGWFQQNNSTPPGATQWFGGNGVFPPHSGAGHIAANFNNATGANDISNWLLTPNITLQNGDVFTFWTRTVDFPSFPDRLQVRMSTSGASTNVGVTPGDLGDFTTLLLDINPTLTTAGYPTIWTQYTVTISGLGGPTSGRLAFRYFVPNGGPSGANSDYIGIDDVAYTSLGGATYAWSNGDNTQTTTVSTSGTYTVTVTDGNGCSGTGSASVTINTNPVVTLGGPYVACGSYTLDAGAGYTSYLWNDNSTAQTLTATATGTYSVTVTDGNTCTGSGSADVTINPVPADPISVTGYALCEGSTVPSGQGLTAVATGSVPGVSTVNVTFTNAAGDETTTSPGIVIGSITLPVLPAGSVVTGATVSIPGIVLNGASWANEIRLELSGAITQAGTQIGTTTSSPNPFTGTFTIPAGNVPITGGVVTVNYYETFNDLTSAQDATFPATGTLTIDYTAPPALNWYDAPSAGNLVGTGSPFDPLGGGVDTPAGTTTYYVEAASATCSSARIPADFTINSNPVVNLGNDVNLCGGSVTLDAGNAGSTYAWSNGATSQTITVSTPGTYSVTVTSNGCTATDEIIVSADTDAPVLSTCGGGTFTITISPLVTFIDETTWTLTDAGGNVVGSGGPYGSSPVTATVVANTGGPFTFFIEAQGTFNDNDASYSISCGGNVVASGGVSGGGTALSSGICCGTIAGCPADVTVDNDAGVCGAVVSYATPTATDNCPGVTVTQTAGLASGSVFPIGTTTNTFLATDASGNADTCSFDVTVNDTEAPILTCSGGTFTITISPLVTFIDETTWTLTDAGGNVVGSGGPYGSSPVTATVVANTGGPFTFFIEAQGTFNDNDASYSISCGGNVVASGVVSGGGTASSNGICCTPACPANVTVDNDAGVCGTVVTYTSPTASDNCPGVTVMQTAGLASGSVFPIGTTTNTFEATDASGNTTALCSFDVTVNDTELPVVTCPSNVTVSNDTTLCGATVTFTVGATDNCPGVTVVSTPASGSVFPVGTTTVTSVATDASGNTATCSFDVTVNDTEAPVLACNGGTFTITIAGGGFLDEISWTMTDGGGNVIGSGGPYGFGTTNTETVIGATGPFTFFIEAQGTFNDNNATYSISCGGNVVASGGVGGGGTASSAGICCGGGCPADVTVDNDAGVCGAVVTYTSPTGTDNCPGAVTVVSTPASGSVFPVGTTTVTSVATDVAGNSATICSFNVTVNDTELPVVACPSNITTVNDAGLCGAAVTFSSTATDNCSGVTVVSTPASGSVFPVGTTTVTSVATDASGNTATCSFDVTVNDTEAPVVTCPGDINVSNDAGQCSAVVSYTTPTATDNCGGSPVSVSASGLPIAITDNATATSTQSVASFGAATLGGAVSLQSVCFSIDHTFVGDLQVTLQSPNGTSVVLLDRPGYTGTGFGCGGDDLDMCVVTGTGNEAEAVCGNLPAISGSYTAFGGVDLNSINNGGNANGTWQLFVTDNAGGDVGNIVAWSLTFSGAAPTVVQTAGLASGAVFPVGTTTNTFTSTDAAGNVGTCSFDVTVNDTELPVITCPSNVTVSNDATVCGATVTFTVGATDNCPGVTVVSTPASGSVFPVGTTTVTSVATDASGNTATCSFDVTVNDTEAPVLSTCSGGSFDITVAGGGFMDEIGWTLTDGGGNVVGSGGPYGSGSTNTVTVTSANGPFTFSIEAQGTFNDNNATYSISCGGNVVASGGVSGGGTALSSGICCGTVVGCPAAVTVDNDPGVCGAVVFYAAPTATDNCLGVTVTQTAGLASGSVFPIGITTNTFLATDASGNTATCSFDVTVNDTEAPLLTCAGGSFDITVAGTGFLDEIGWTLTNVNGTVVGSGGPYTSGSTNTVTITDANGPFTFFIEAQGFYNDNNATYSISCGGNIVASGSVTGTFNGGSGTASSSGICCGEACPSDVTVDNDAGVCGAVVTYTSPTASDNCPGVTVTQTAGLASGSVFPIGTTTNTFEATDASGNTTALCSFDVTVNDTELPVIICPSNVTVSNDAGLCGAAVTFNVGATDNCPGTIVTQTAGLASGSVFPVGTTTNTFLATDASGNTATCSFDVTVNDTEAPVLSTCSGGSFDITVAGAGFMDEIGWTLTDVGGNVVGSGGPYGSGSTNTVTVTSANGPFTFSIEAQGTFNDNNATYSISCGGNVVASGGVSGGGTALSSGICCGTVAGCPADVTVDNDAGVCGAAVFYAAPTATDNCPGVTVTQTAGLASGSVFPIGTTTNTFEAEDAAGNITTCSFDVTVEDTEAPVLTCAGGSFDITVAGIGYLDEISWTLTNVNGTVVGSGGPYGFGSTNTVTITDANGPFTFFIEAQGTFGDNDATYSISCGGNVVASGGVSGGGTAASSGICCGEACPSDVTVDNDAGVCGAVVTYTSPTASDNCPGVTVTQTAGLASGSVFPIGTTTNTFEATDASGNTTALCSFDVTVNDTELPVITCPSNVTVSNDTTVCGATVTFTVGATDNCVGVTVVSTPASGSVFPVGTTTVTSVATDASGNTATCSFDVTVEDTEAPVITCQADISVDNDAGVCGATVTYSTTATDNCSGVTVAQTAGLASGSVFPVGTTTNTFVATDAAGNTATCSFDVTVNDTELPVITCQADIDVNNDAGECGATVTYTATTATDNCPGVTVTQTAGLASGSVFPIGTTTNTFEATDAEGNTATCSFDVTVTDSELPVVTCPADITTCDPVVTFSATATDNCGVSSITYNPASGSTFAVGTTVVTATAIDDNGNTGTCTFNVTVYPTPVVDLGPDVTQCGGSTTLDAGNAGATYEWSDNSTSQTLTVTATGTYSVTVTNADGCSASGSINVTIGAVPVVDLGPDISQCGGSATLDAGNAGATYEWSDNSTLQTLTVTASGNYSVTVTNADGCSASGSIDVTIGAVPVVDLGADITQCGGTVTLDAGNTGSTYEWSDNSTAQTFTVTATGTYSVTVTSADGCSASSTIDVTIGTLPVVNLGNDIVQCGGNATLDAGNGGATYLWSDNSTSQTLTVTSSGTYSVTVTNADGCSASSSVVVDINATPVVDLGPDVTECGSATLDAGNPGSIYSWSDNTTFQTATVTASGTYSVTVMDNGCTASDAINVQINPLPQVSFSLPLDTVCSTASPVTLSGGSPTGGTYSGPGVSGGVFNPATGAADYTITYTYTDGSGCTNTATDNIVVEICTDLGNVALGKVTLYPNPATDYVELNVEGMKGQLNVEIFDMIGQLVMSVTGNIESDTYERIIDISALSSANYYVRVSVAGNQSTFDMIVLQR